MAISSRLGLLRAYDYQEQKRVRREDFVCQHPFTFPTLMADGTLVACEQDYNCAQAYREINAIDLIRRTVAKPASFRDPGGDSRQPAEFRFCSNCPYADRPVSSCSIQSFELRPFTP